MNGETEGEGFGETAKLAQREAASFVLQKYHQLPSQSLNRQRGPDLAIEDRLSAIFQVRISRDDIALIFLMLLPRQSTYFRFSLAILGLRVFLRASIKS